MADSVLTFENRNGVVDPQVALHKAAMTVWVAARVHLDAGVRVLDLLTHAVEHDDELLIAACRMFAQAYLVERGRNDEAKQLARVLGVLDEARQAAKASVMAAVVKASK